MARDWGLRGYESEAVRLQMSDSWSFGLGLIMKSLAMSCSLVDLSLGGELFSVFFFIPVQLLLSFEIIYIHACSSNTL